MKKLIILILFILIVLAAFFAIVKIRDGALIKSENQNYFEQVATNALNQGSWTVDGQPV